LIANSSPSYIATDIQGWDHPKITIVDLFAGTGGNTIAFALSGAYGTVIAIERDSATLACAQHNAALHAVPAGRIIWVLADCFSFLEKALCDPEALDPELRIDPTATVLFASPPWGGPGYRTDDVFDLAEMQPYNLAKLHGACRPVDHALYLPRTSDIRQIARLVPEGQKIDVVQYCMEGASKAMVAYLPGQGSPLEPTP
jgi:trimethylguanosine synthase